MSVRRTNEGEHQSLPLSGIQDHYSVALGILRVQVCLGLLSGHWLTCLLPMSLSNPVFFYRLMFVSRTSPGSSLYSTVSLGRMCSLIPVKPSFLLGVLDTPYIFCCRISCTIVLPSTHPPPHHGFRNVCENLPLPSVLQTREVKQLVGCSISKFNYGISISEVYHNVLRHDFLF